MQVPLHIKDRIRIHLGYDRPRAINAATLQLFEQHLNNVFSDNSMWGKNMPSIIVLLERCDKLFRMTDPTDSIVFTQFQQILGDVNRSTRTLSIDDVIRKNREIYYLSCDDLAFQLNVPNLRRPGNASSNFVQLGSSYVISPPGNPDTCVSDRIYLSLNLC